MLQSSEKQRQALVVAYYDCLNDDAKFRQSFATFFERLDGLDLPDGHRGRYSIQEFLSTSSERTQSITGDHLRDRARLYRQWQIPAGLIAGDVANALDSLAEFLDIWPLPPEGAADLWQRWEVHDGAQKQGVPSPSVRLAPGTRFRWVPTPGLSVETGHINLGLEGFSGGLTVTFVENQPWIIPNVPLPFRYDPTKLSRQSLHEIMDKICAGIRQSILAQADEYEWQVKEAGWRSPPPYQDWPHLCWRARLVYLRAVKKVSWSRIVIDAPHPDGKRRSRSYVIGQAQATASTLGIPVT